MYILRTGLDIHAMLIAMFGLPHCHCCRLCFFLPKLFPEKEKKGFGPLGEVKIVYCI